MKALLKSCLFNKNNFLKTFVSLCLITGANFAVHAQVNLVLNGGFEDYISCPNGGDQINRALGWDTLRMGGGGLPEYCNVCAKTTSVDIPNNFAGYQKTHSGKGYSALLAFIDDSSYFIQREYIQGILKSKLIQAQAYCVTFHIVLSNMVNTRGVYAIDEFGAYIDDGSILAENDRAANVLPQIKSLSVTGGGVYLEDTLNWMKIQGNYTANGTEQYITLGNFRDYANTNYKQMGTCNGIPPCVSYYYLDDVSVVEINTKASAGNDTTIIKGDTAFVGLHDIGDAYTWYANGTAFYTGSEAGLYVTPTINTTYVCKQTVCSVVTYDTCVVTVKPVGINESLQFERLKIWPNPVNNGQLIIDSGEWVTGIEVYSVLGERMLESKYVRTLNVSSLPKGLYMLRLSDAKGNSVIRKVVIDN